MKNILQQNKHLFILPLIVIPFVVFIFYILGGGAGDKKTEETNANQGGNLQLPEADRQIEILDKKEAYQQMASEGKQRVSIEVDTLVPVLQVQLKDTTDEADAQTQLLAHIKAQEEQVRQAMKQSNAPGTVDHQKNNRPQTHSSQRSRHASMHQPSRANSALDEMEAFESLMEAHEKLIRQNNSLHQQVKKQVQHSKTNEPQRKSHQVEVGIKMAFIPGRSSQSIRVQVVEDTRVMTGNRVMLRLMQDIKIAGQTLRKGTFIYGLCKNDNERLHIRISSIPIKNQYLPVQLSAYDLDGIKGLYVPDHVARKTYKDVVANINPSVLMSPTGEPISYMGVNAMNTISRSVSKGVRQKKVRLRQNTVILLQNE